MDFYLRDHAHPAEVEVTLTDLSLAIEQQFFDYLEIWDNSTSALLPESETLEESDEHQPTALRLCYRATWVQEDETGEHWVYYPKASDPSEEHFVRARRQELAALPVKLVRPRDRVLSLAAQGGLREVLDAGGDLPAALDVLMAELDQMGSNLAQREQVQEALDAVLAPMRSLLGLDTDNPATKDILSFVPEGGALGALLRSLAPVADFGDGVRLPIWKHGSTTQASFAASEVLAQPEIEIVLLDDFGDGLDRSSAEHLSAMLRTQTDQTWTSTRSPAAARPFDAEELIRLGFDGGGNRTAYAGKEPATKPERLAARSHLLQVLPAISARAVLILEGPHDRFSLEAVADRRLSTSGTPLPAATRIALIDAAAADSSGGYSAIPRLAQWASDLGLWTVAILDGDPGDPGTKALEATKEAAHSVIRLPERAAIERALVEGLPDDQVRAALKATGADLPDDFDEVEGPDLSKTAIKALKSRGGVHGQFVGALPEAVCPPLVERILDAATQAVDNQTVGLIQL